MTNKALYKIAILMFLAIGFFSCEDTNGDNFRTDTESGWVQHEAASTITVFAGFHPSTINIPVSLNTNVNKSGLDVQYVIEDVVGVSSSILSGNSGVVTFGKGVISSDISLGFSPANIPASGLVFDVKLISTSRDNVSVGAAESTPTTRRVCIKKIEAGTYTGEVYYYEHPNTADMEFISTFTTELTETDVVGSFNISTAWGPVFVPTLTGNPAHSIYTYPGVITFNTSDNSGALTLNSTAAYGTSGNVGSVSCSGDITYTLSQGLFANDAIRAYVVIRPAN